MSEEMEPVAKAPEEGNAVEASAVENFAADNAQPSTVVTESNSVTKWPWAIVAGIALVAGIGGFALGQGTDGRELNVNAVGNHRNFDQNGLPELNGQGGQQGQMPMGPHCENTAGDHVTVGSDGSCPDGYTLDDKGPGMMGGGKMGHGKGMMQGQGQIGQMPMGPHCEDTTGAHAPVNADGSCPTGFTLDDKNMGPQGGLVAPSPTASGATS